MIIEPRDFQTAPSQAESSEAFADDADATVKRNTIPDELDERVLSSEHAYFRDASRRIDPSYGDNATLGPVLESQRKALRLATFRSGFAVDAAIELLEDVTKGERAFDRIVKVDGPMARRIRRRLGRIVEKLRSLANDRRDAWRPHVESAVKQRQRPQPKAAAAAAHAMEPVARILTALRIEMKFVYSIIDRTEAAMNDLARRERSLLRNDRRTPVEETSIDAWRDSLVQAGTDVTTMRRQQRMIHTTRSEYSATLNSLCDLNLRLVMGIAKEFLGRGLPFLDLVQEGNLGLMIALEKFEPSRGCQLSTHATWWIRQAVQRAVASQSRVVRVPQNKVALLGKLERHRRDFIESEGREPRSEDLAALGDFTLHDVLELRPHLESTISVDQPLGDEESSVGNVFLRADESETPLDAAQRSFLKRIVMEVIDELPERHGEIVKERYGIEHDHASTLRELGKNHGLTHERIRQITSAALEELRQSDRLRALVDAKLN